MLNNKKIYFISVNPFCALPLMRYIIPLFDKIETQIITIHISGFYLFSENGKQKNVHIFNNLQDLNTHSKMIWIKKYSKVYFQLIKIFLFRKHSLIYVIDFQVLAFCLILKRIIKSKFSIIYHQFELFDPAMSGGLNKRTQSIVLKNTKLIDLIIFPEINRSKFFYKLSGNIHHNTMLIPNTNNLVNQKPESAEQITGIPAKNTVVAHIGNLGSAHYTLKYFEFIQQNTNPDLTFLFIGKVESILLPMLTSMAEKDKRIIIIKEVFHHDLIKYYQKINIGIILYKAVDKNNEYCAPNKLYEYWAHGIPVIAHQLKSLEDIWWHDFQGRLIDFETMSQMEASIHELIINKDSYPNALRDWFRKEASIDTYLPVLLDKIENL